MNTFLGDQTESVPKRFAASSSKAQGDVPSPVLWRDSESALPESKAAVSVHTQRDSPSISISVFSLADMRLTTISTDNCRDLKEGDHPPPYNSPSEASEAMGRHILWRSRELGRDALSYMGPSSQCYGSVSHGTVASGVCFHLVATLNSAAITPQAGSSQELL